VTNGMPYLAVQKSQPGIISKLLAKARFRTAAVRRPGCKKGTSTGDHAGKMQAIGAREFSLAQATHTQGNPLYLPRFSPLHSHKHLKRNPS
jgi:hypothetical protein